MTLKFGQPNVTKDELLFSTPHRIIIYILLYFYFFIQHLSSTSCSWSIVTSPWYNSSQVSWNKELLHQTIYEWLFHTDTGGSFAEAHNAGGRSPSR